MQQYLPWSFDHPFLHRGGGRRESHSCTKVINNSCQPAVKRVNEGLSFLLLPWMRKRQAPAVTLGHLSAHQGPFQNQALSVIQTKARRCYGELQSPSPAKEWGSRIIHQHASHQREGLSFRTRMHVWHTEESRFNPWHLWLKVL